MLYTKISSGYVIRLDPGEEVIETLEGFTKEQNIKGAIISGIGVICDPELGFYNQEEGKYSKKSFPGDYEVVSLNGNISYFEENPVIHIHTTISGEDFISYSGHLFSARAAVTVEIFLITQEQELRRARDPIQGLNLLAL